MINSIIIVIVVAAMLLAGLYIYSAKKNGRKCIGCPNGGCSSQCTDTCGCCNCHINDK